MRSRKVDESVREALVRALENFGCPAVTAAEIAGEARVEWHGLRFGNPAAWMLMLETPGADRGIEYPAEPQDVDATVRQLAANVAADNAEAWDRIVRGDQVWTALWPLPDRGPRG